jgi:hypothetical protein
LTNGECVVWSDVAGVDWVIAVAVLIDAPEALPEVAVLGSDSLGAKKWKLRA